MHFWSGDLELLIPASQILFSNPAPSAHLIPSQHSWRNWFIPAFFCIAFLWNWNENWPFPVLWPLLSFPNLLAYWVQHFHSIIISATSQTYCQLAAVLYNLIALYLIHDQLQILGLWRPLWRKNFQLRNMWPYKKNSIREAEVMCESIKFIIYFYIH